MTHRCPDEGNGLTFRLQNLSARAQASHAAQREHACICLIMLKDTAESEIQLQLICITAIEDRDDERGSQGNNDG